MTKTQVFTCVLVMCGFHILTASEQSDSNYFLQDYRLGYKIESHEMVAHSVVYNQNGYMITLRRLDDDLQNEVWIGVIDHDSDLYGSIEQEISQSGMVTVPSSDEIVDGFSQSGILNGDTQLWWRFEIEHIRGQHGLAHYKRIIWRFVRGSQRGVAIDPERIERNGEVYDLIVNSERQE